MKQKKTVIFLEKKKKKKKKKKMLRIMIKFSGNVKKKLEYREEMQKNFGYTVDSRLPELIGTGSSSDSEKFG